ncbi:hypothetical protein [Bradyrhizobium sp. sGM-13]|uniref:hypothetical protein n=1 Tax=Bradyrhizobium sp. sGM-13 TaxID=2831781 RepID=UPI001BCCB1F5|nr:hypothetical protein [Bradyrhizobium sp. sGM-13]
MIAVKAASAVLGMILQLRMPRLPVIYRRRNAWPFAVIPICLNLVKMSSGSALVRGLVDIPDAVCQASKRNVASRPIRAFFVSL